MKLKKNEESFLKHVRVVRVATADAEGTPHAVPICPVMDGGTICFGTDAKSKKARNLKQNPRIAVNYDEYSEDWSRLRGILVHGEAEILTPGKEFLRIRKLLYTKFPQYQEQAQLEGEGVIIVKITPTNSVSWGL